MSEKPQGSGCMYQLLVGVALLAMLPCLAGGLLAQGHRVFLVFSALAAIFGGWQVLKGVRKGGSEGWTLIAFGLFVLALGGWLAVSLLG